jgi:hypothetical protein
MSDQTNTKKLNLELEFPLAWIEKIELLAQANEQSISEIIVDLVGNNLGLNVENLKINRLFNNYQNLEKRLGLLETKDYQIERLNHRLEIMEKLMAQLQTKRFSSPSSLLSLPVEDYEDEIEDEPDEILTDFLV